MITELTDSFCERCGTHYTFNAEPAKNFSIKNARLLARGLRNFVMNDGQSFTDSMQFARNDDHSEDSVRLTEAFHKAFNFCMTCRQYACEKCWNVKQGACFTCAPDPSQRPVEHETRLIVRTPAAHADEFAPGALNPLHFGEFTGPTDAVPPTATFAGPSAFGGPSSGAGPATFSAAPLFSAGAPDELQADWPAADRVDETAADPTARKMPEWRARFGSVDGETIDEQLPDPWRVWPIADPLAPEATLTPEELHLVQSQLSTQAPEAEEAGFVPMAAEPVGQPAVEPAFTQPVEPQPVPAPEPAVVAAPRIAEPARPATPATPKTAGHPSNGPWPYPTPWLERPNRIPFFALEAAAQADGPAAPDATVPLADEWAAPAPVAQPQAVAFAAPELAMSQPIQPEAASLPQAPVPLPVEPVYVEPAAAAAALAASAPDLADLQRRARFALVSSDERVRLDEAKTRPVPAPMPGPATPQMPAAPVAPTPASPAVAPAPPTPTPAPEAFTIQPHTGMAFRRSPFQAPEVAAASQSQRPAEPLEPSKPLYTDPLPAGWPPLGAKWPSPPASPVWPGPQGAAPSPAILSAQSAAAAPPAAQTAMAARDVWGESTQEVISHGSARVCHHCSLPVSTHARFCRRCGTSQI